MTRVVYLDYNASTPCDPRVVQAMAPYWTADFANPASRQHGPGRSAFMALEEARRAVAQALAAASPTEIVFTSGATESNNLAVKGVARGADAHRRHLVTQSTEHPAVLEVVRGLEKEGYEATVVGVGAAGRVDPEAIAAAIRPDTIIVSVMLANNETGVIQPIREIVQAAHTRGVLVHCDAAQAIGKIPVSLAELGVDLLSVSGHKVYGPKGTGALYVKRRTPALRLEPTLDGGGHEGGRRSGTPNLPGAVGLARALGIACEGLASESRRLSVLRDDFESRIREALPRVMVNGDAAARLPGTSNLAFPGVDGAALLASLPDLAISSGSACASAHPEPSPVLRAMGLGPKIAASSIRVSFGRFSTAEEAHHATERIIAEARRLGR